MDAVADKLTRYAKWGVLDILVFDPIGREAWFWDIAAGSLTSFKGSYPFQSKPVQLVLDPVFSRL